MQVSFVLICGEFYFFALMYQINAIYLNESNILLHCYFRPSPLGVALV